MAPTPFRFPAVAALAGRAPLGGQREVALGTFLAARLALDTQPDRGLPAPSRVERAAQAKTWLSTMTLPPPVRTALLQVIDASAHEAPAAAEALRGLLVAAASFLDARSRTELERLAGTLDR